MGDILQSLFFSPKEPGAGWIVGAGPGLPAADRDHPLSRRREVQPRPDRSRAAPERRLDLRHPREPSWSVAGTSHTGNVNSTFLQPFLTYTSKTHTTFGHQHRVHLRLGQDQVDDPDQSVRQPDAQDRPSADQSPARTQALRRRAEQRAGLGHPVRVHPAVPDLTRQQGNDGCRRCRRCEVLRRPEARPSDCGRRSLTWIGVLSGLCRRPRGRSPLRDQRDLPDAAERLPATATKARPSAGRRRRDRRRRPAPRRPADARRHPPPLDRRPGRLAALRAP